MGLEHAIGVVVPLAALLADQHRAGYTFFVYPSALAEDQNGQFYASALSASPPTDARDAAYLPPESQGQYPGDARGSVYAVGALLYELITLQSVGPNMRRPSEIVPGLPPMVELILQKALVTDPRYRPDDLNALAQALYDINPTHSIAPPPADTSSLQAGGIDIDVSLSMLPPPPVAQVPPGGGVPPSGVQPGSGPHAGGSPYGLVVQQAPAASAPTRGPEGELAALKARLEADPAARYVVVRDGMDHGPFNAVELLQQIASNTFEPQDVVRDNVSGNAAALEEHADFSVFAKHAQLNRQQKAEKAALERVVAQESRSTKGKAFLGIAVVGALVAAGAVWFLTQRGAKSDEIAVHEETVANIEADANLNVPKRKGGGGKRVVGKNGKYPMLAGGMSCEAAQAAYVEEMRMDGGGPADLTQGQFQAVLSRGTYLNGCGVPDNMSVSICAAVQNGRAVGVSVTTSPRSGRHQSCIAGAVRRLSFPSNPKLDIARTTFAAQ